MATRGNKSGWLGLPSTLAANILGLAEWPLCHCPPDTERSLTPSDHSRSLKPDWGRHGLSHALDSHHSTDHSPGILSCLCFDDVVRALNASKKPR